MQAYSEMPHLNSELESILLGYYDFDRFSAILGAHDDPSLISITLMHEALHQRLNNQSTFGARLQDAAKSDRTYFRILLRNCTTVHEMLATYVSLVEHGREDLVEQLPNDYQCCFNQMRDTVRYVPATKNWRASSAWHLARMAMMTSEQGSVAELDSPDHRMMLLHDAMQDFDFDSFEGLMKKWGAPKGYLSAFIDHEDPTDICDAMDKPVTEWPAILDNWHYVLMHAFMEMYRELLPGIEEHHDHHTLVKMVRDSPWEFKLGNENWKRRAFYVENCNQRVAFYEDERFVADFPQYGGSVLMSAQLSTFRDIRTVYLLYLFVVDTQKGPVQGGVTAEVHVTDYQPKGKIAHWVISGPNAVSSYALTEPIISILEIDGNDHVWDRLFIERLCQTKFDGSPFLYCHSNPIIMLERLMGDGGCVEWCAYGISYDDGSVEADYGLNVCIYWLEACSIPIFHLSNLMMTTEIGNFCDTYVANETHMKRIGADELSNRTSTVDLSRLNDHPVFQYYLSGRTAAACVEHARRLKENKAGRTNDQ